MQYISSPVKEIRILSILISSLFYLFLSYCTIFNPQRPNPGQSEKIKLIFYFHTSLWCLKGFMKAFKAFIKPFEAPQRSVKIKI